MSKKQKQTTVTEEGTYGITLDDVEVVTGRLCKHYCNVIMHLYAMTSTTKIKHQYLLDLRYDACQKNRIIYSLYLHCVIKGTQ